MNTEPKKGINPWKVIGWLLILPVFLFLTMCAGMVGIGVYRTTVDVVPLEYPIPVVAHVRI